MRTITVKDEQNLAALRANVLRADASGPALEGADAAIRAANPHLDLDRLRPGSVVVLPDHPAIEATEPPAAAVGALDLRAALQTAREAVSHGPASAERRHTHLRKALAAPELARAARADPKVRAQLHRVAEALAEGERQAAQWASAMTEVLDRWRAELDQPR